MIGERAMNTVVMLDGDLPSMIAVTAVREEMELHRRNQSGAASGTRIGVCAVPWVGSGPRVHAAVQRLADVEGWPVVRASMPELGDSIAPGVRESIGLMVCAHAAAVEGFSRVVWPATAGLGEGLDLDRLAAIVDRAMLCGRVVAIDANGHGQPAIHIEAPYADLTDRQIADLALDLSVPLEGCWWWGGQDAATELARARWMPRLVEMGYVADRGRDG